MIDKVVTYLASKFLFFHCQIVKFTVAMATLATEDGLWRHWLSAIS